MLKNMCSLTNNSTKIAGSCGSESEISSSAPNTAPNSDERNEREQVESASIALPAHVAGSGTLDRLIDTARGYAEASTAENTNKAYAADWKHFTRWCRLKGTEPLPPAPEMIGLYVADLAAPTGKAPALSDSGGWLEIFDKGALLTLNAKTGWREVEVGRGSSEQTCPVHALKQWLHFAKIDFGPAFVRTSRDGKRALEARLSDKHVARLIKATVLKSGVRSDLPEAKRLAMFSGHSLRAGLASSAEVDERYVQKQLGHASAEMTRRYQRRRDRFRVNLTKAAGL